MSLAVRVNNVSEFSFQIFHSDTHKRIRHVDGIKPGTPRLQLDYTVRRAVRICSGVAEQERYDHYYYPKSIFSRALRKLSKGKAQPPDAVPVPIVGRGRIFRGVLH
jgi:hypothetical protein